MTFKCPVCGSYCFGSWRNDDGTLTRQCHGYIQDSSGMTRACTFQWPESDDAKYGLEDPSGEPEQVGQVMDQPNLPALVAVAKAAAALCSHTTCPAKGSHEYHVHFAALRAALATLENQ